MAHPFGFYGQSHRSDRVFYALTNPCGILFEDTAWMKGNRTLFLRNALQQGENSLCVVLSGEEEKFASKGSDPVGSA